MRVMLINPPNCGRSIPEEEYGITAVKQIFRGEPLALETLAGNLDSHETIIVDLKVAPESLWDEYARFKPDVIGFTAVTCEAGKVLKLACKIKEQHQPIIVVGGIHATYDPEFFNREEIDYIVMGLGKKSFRELVDHLEKKQDTRRIPGVARANPGKALSCQKRKFDAADLVEDKAPRYDLVARYRNAYILTKLNMELGFIVTALGCTHQCSFCSVPKITGNRYINHSIDSVIRDIKLLGDIPFIRMVDANSFGDAAYSQELCQRLLDEGIKKKLVADVRADTVVNHTDLMAKWKSAGLANVIVGFEEIDSGQLKKFNKCYAAEINVQAIQILHDNGIAIVGDFIVSPDYEHKDFDRLQKFISENKIEIPVLSILTPVPGTPLYRKVKDQIEIHDLDYYTFLNAVTPTKLPRKDFYQTFAETFMSFYKK